MSMKRFKNSYLIMALNVAEWAGNSIVKVEKLLDPFQKWGLEFTSGNRGKGLRAEIIEKKCY